MYAFAHGYFSSKAVARIIMLSIWVHQLPKKAVATSFVSYEYVVINFGGAAMCSLVLAVTLIVLDCIYATPVSRFP